MSPSGIASNRQAEARLRRAHERIRERFLAAATRYFRATDDAQREQIREHVLEMGYGLEQHELAALSDAARLAARGAGHGRSGLTTTTRPPGG